MLENQQFCKPKTPSLCKIDLAAQIVEKKKKKEGEKPINLVLKPNLF